MSMYITQSGAAINKTSTGSVFAGACQLEGFYVNSTTGGTLVLRDGGAAGVGTVMSGTITPAIGFHFFPAIVGTSLHATIANTLDVTFFVAS